jgi:DNA-binding CsgD family transcriptional regulator
MLVELQNLEIDDGNYRHDCYMSVGLDRRLSLLQRRPNETIQINAYSKRGNNRLSHGMLEIASNLEALFALVLKHRDLTFPDSASLEDTFRRRLRMACPAMPEREMEVCVSIAKGLSSEAMAIELGISVNTVLTYRKRAYIRLNITSHNELMRLMIGRLD